MPGLQSIVSAWTKINHQNVEYIGETNDFSPPQHASGSPDQKQQQQQGQGGVQAADGGAGGVVDPRPGAYANANAPQQPFPSLPSSSSLSSYSFSKNGAAGTADTTALTPTASARRAAPPLPPHDARNALWPSSSRPSPSPRSRRGGPHRLTHPPGSGHLHSQLESYGQHHHRQAAANFPPPPQAGADAILGRRKVSPSSLVDRGSGGVGVASSLSHGVPLLGEPPASLRSGTGAVAGSDASPPHALSSSAATSRASGGGLPGAGGPPSHLGRSPSSSLWHSHSARSGSSTSSSAGMTRTSTKASIAKLNATAEDALRSMNGLELTAGAGGGAAGGGGGAQQQQQLKPNPVGQNLNHPHFNPTTVPAAKGRRLARQRLARSHSRSDLARDMALDRRGARASAGDDGGGPGGPGVGRSVTADEPDVTRGSIRGVMEQQQRQQQHSGESQHKPRLQSQLQPQPQILKPQQRPQRVPSFLSNALDGHGGGMLMRTNSGSSHSRAPLSDAARRPMEGLNDPWMQDWFPHHPLPNNRRQTSSSSSGTAVTANRGEIGRPGADVSKNNDAFTVEGSPTATPSGGDGDDAGAPPLPLPLPSKPPPLRGNPGCDRCAQMETALLSLQADLEYLRTLDLQREFACKDCDAASAQQSVRGLDRMDSSLPPIQQNTLYPTLSSQRSDVSLGSVGSERGSRAGSSRVRGRRKLDSNSIGTGPRPRSHGTPAGRVKGRTSAFLREASRRLSDLSTRHKRQVKQATHERAYWQNDMHLKLEKFAMMCKNLNEEAAHRSNEARETKAQLDRMTGERNALVSQVDTLRARVALYEDESAEQARLREEWARERGELLGAAAAAMEKRDAACDELASRLDLAAETIVTERRQHHMRRQIIFPAVDSRSGGAPPSPLRRSNATSDGDDLERIQRTREAAEVTKMSLKEAMIQSAEREKEMRLRLNALERELAETQVGINGGKARGEAPSTAGANGGMSIRCVNSTSSLTNVG